MDDSPTTDPRASEPPSWQLTGRTLGNYRLLHRLGVGGMAEVYLAEQPSLQRQVAIKVLRRDLAAQPDYVKRFQNEARAVAALVHANIVQIYEVGCSDDGIHFIAQEYVPGQNLKQCVTRLGPLPTGRCMSILRQVGAALNRAAQRNIVHRDIKPENILLMPNGEVKVADFGLARVVDAQQVDLTQAGITMGTPLYMSPEQVEGKPQDHRSDLYALGATAFYMLTGRPPFLGDTPLSVAIQHLQAAPPDLQQMRPDLPDDLRVIVQRLLAKSPAERFSSAQELLQALRDIPAPAQESWPGVEDTLPWTAAEQGLSEPLDATVRLQTLLRTTPQPRARAAASGSRRWLTWLSYPLAILIGASLAYLIYLRPKQEAGRAENSSRVARQESASKQFFYAAILNTEAAWLSVAAEFPPDQSNTNRLYARRAQQELAAYYLDHNQPEKAQTVYQELANLPDEGDAFAKFPLIGQMGLAMVAEKEGHFAQARELARRALEQASRISQFSDLPSEMIERMRALTQEARAPQSSIRRDTPASLSRRSQPPALHVSNG